MKPISIMSAGRAAFLLLALSFAPPLRAEIVYDNSTTRSTPARFQQVGGVEFGDEILLSAAAPCVLTNFVFEYFGLNFSGDETVRLRIYANDLLYGTNFYAPGTVLYDSDSFAIGATAAATLSLANLNVVVPTRFTWTVQFGGIDTGESAGLSLYNPPTVGSNPVDYWERSATNTWLLFGPDPSPALSFGARVLASLDPPLQLYSPSPASPFSLILSPFDPGNRPAGIWLGNLRGDGNMRDIMTANSESASVSVLLFLGEGNFSTPAVYSVGNNPQGIRGADFNRDGSDDIAVANYDDDTVSILINLGGGLLFTPRSDYPVGAGPKAITVADMNRDGFLDLMVANYLGNSISLVSGLGGGLFNRNTVATLPVGSGPASITIGDFHGDGFQDLVTADELSGTLSLLRGWGDGSFSAPVVVMSDPDYQPTCALAGDLDGDGVLDLAVASYKTSDDTGIVRILKGQGDGTFVAGLTYAVGTHPQSLLVRDLNRDAILDVVVANSGDDNVTVLLGAGDGTFLSQGTFAVGDKPTVVVGSNFNEDRATDLAVVNTGDVFPGSTVSVLMYNAPLADNLTVTGYEDAPVNISLAGRVFGATPDNLDYFLYDTNGVVIGPGGGPTRHGWLQQVRHTRRVTYTPGPHRYAPNPGDSQLDSFTYYTRDRLGTLESLPATCSLRVIPVNDPPDFDFSPVFWNPTNSRFEVVVMEDAPAVSFPAFAVNLSRGGWKEDSQSLSFLVVPQDSYYFTSKPRISSVGTLTFQVARDWSSSGTKVTVRLRDSGGTASGGVNVNPPLSALPEEFFVVINPNPLKPFKGTYSGLYYPVDGLQIPVASHQASGFFTFTMTAGGTSANGALSGKLIGDGGSFGFTGQFDASGHALVPVNRPNSSTLFLDLNLDPNPASNRVSGYVTAEGNTWTANHLEGYRSVFAASPAPWAGRYTIAYPGLRGSAGTPGGDGYATLSVSSAGAVRAVGRMGDGASFSQSATLSPDGRWPFYAYLYRGNGSALGWLQFSSPSNLLELAATNQPINWVRPAAIDRLYPAGFTAELFPVASFYTPPLPGAPLFPGENVPGLLTFQDGNLSQPHELGATFTQGNDVAVGAVPYLRLSSYSLGLMSGLLSQPGLGSRSVRGVVLQLQRSVHGYFLGVDQSGSAVFEPDP